MDNPRKKVLIVASVASMIDLFNKENIDILRKMGYSVDVAANFEKGNITSKKRVRQFRKELDAEGIKAFHVPITRSLFDFKDLILSFRKLKNIIEAGNYAMIHCHSPIGGVLCRVAALKARKNGTKIVYTAHGFHFYDGAPLHMWMLYYPVERFLARFTDVMITINEEDYRRALTFKTGEVKKVSGIGIHVDDIKNAGISKALTEYFHLSNDERNERSREEIRARFGFGPDDYIFFSVGQLSVRKNQITIIKAFQYIKNKNIKYLIIGLGEKRKELKDIVKQMHLEDRVIIAGYMDNAWNMMYAFDAFVFPSMHEGLPVSLMEAMAAGLPVVCSNIRGNIDLIEEGAGGFLCKYNDPEGFACKMDELAGNKELSIRMAMINQENAQKYDAGIVRKQMEEIYGEI